MNKSNISILTITLLLTSATGMSSVANFTNEVYTKDTFEIEQISLGYYHSTVVTNDFKGQHLYTWGRNNYGQLGFGPIGSRYYKTPQEIEYDGEIQEIKTGFNTNAILTLDENGKEHFYTWGDNRSGQLGLGGTTQESTYNIGEVDINQDGILGNEGNIKFYDSGAINFSVVITDDDGIDHLYLWGENSSGQLGLGPDSVWWSGTPQEVDINNDGILGNEGTIESVALGGYHNFIITKDNQNVEHLYTSGNNTYGQLGPTEELPKYWDIVEIPFDNIDSIKEVELGRWNSSAVLTDEDGMDHLYTWGNNEYGALGTGSTEAIVSTPTEVDFGIYYKEIKEVSLSDQSSSAVLTDEDGVDHLFTWGNNTYGRLGIGEIAGSYNTPQEVKLNETEINQIDLGGVFSGVITTDENNANHFYTWGFNDDGELGLGEESNIQYNSPQEVFLPVNLKFDWTIVLFSILAFILLVIVIIILSILIYKVFMRKKIKQLTYHLNKKK